MVVHVHCLAGLPGVMACPLRHFGGAAGSIREVSRPRCEFKAWSLRRWVWKVDSKGKGDPGLYGRRSSDLIKGFLRHRKSVVLLPEQRGRPWRTFSLKFRFWFIVHHDLFHYALLQSLLNSPRRQRLPSFCFNTDHLDL